MRIGLRPAMLAAGMVILSLAGMGGQAAQKGEKLKPGEVVARHVASLRQPGSTAATTSRKLQGAAEFRILMGGAGNLIGKASFVSGGRQFEFRVDFEDPAYHGERVSFDGEKVEVGTLRPGARTPVGDFLFSNNEIVKEGLFGGALSTAWPLADLASRQAKLKYEGIKSVGGRKVHVLKYQPKKSGDISITLYFEVETFRHVGSVYRMSYGVPIAATPAQAVKQESSEYALEESFGEFEAIAGWTLPTRWKIVYSRQTASRGNSIWQWEIQFDKSSDPGDK